MLRFLRVVRDAWYFDIVKRNKITPLLVFISFLIIFLIARIFSNFFSKISLIINEYHIHHFYYGFVILVISNWILLTSNKQNLKKISALMLGLGSGLIMDEIGLLLTCTTNGKICNYHTRLTFDVITITAGILLAILYSGPFFRLFKRKLLRIS